MVPSRVGQGPSPEPLVQRWGADPDRRGAPSPTIPYPSVPRTSVPPASLRELRRRSRLGGTGWVSWSGGNGVVGRGSERAGRGMDGRADGWGPRVQLSEPRVGKSTLQLQVPSEPRTGGPQAGFGGAIWGNGGMVGSVREVAKQARTFATSQCG